MQAFASQFMHVLDQNADLLLFPGDWAKKVLKIQKVL